jgi:hypothetical protein
MSDAKNLTQQMMSQASKYHTYNTNFLDIQKLEAFVQKHLEKTMDLILGIYETEYLDVNHVFYDVIEESKYDLLKIFYPSHVDNFRSADLSNKIIKSWNEYLEDYVESLMRKNS